MLEIYYFTRSGNSARIAGKLAKALECSSVQIHDDVNWKGFRAYLKFMSYVKGKKTMKVWSDGDPAAADTLVLVSPVWADRLPPTVTQFLAPLDRGRIRLVTTAMSSQLKGDREGFASINCITGKSKNEDEVIAKLVGSLKQQA